MKLNSQYMHKTDVSYLYFRFVSRKRAYICQNGVFAAFRTICAPLFLCAAYLPPWQKYALKTYVCHFARRAAAVFVLGEIVFDYLQ